MTTVDTTTTDRRIFKHTARAIYVRVPQDGHASGRTVAYALLHHASDTRPAHWEVRMVREREPITSCQHREAAADRLDDLTEGWR